MTVEKVASRLPNGQLSSFTESDNYGPVSAKFIFIGISNPIGGPVTVEHFDGQISYLGFGPHTVIEHLVIDTKPLSKPPLR